jgi:microcystin-dependent protein
MSTPALSANSITLGSSTLSTDGTNISLNANPIVPIGVILPFAGTVAPGGWILAYGQAISRTTYANLFSIIGTTYGAGDTLTTFNLPDLRGNVPAGKDNMGGSPANRLTNSTTGGVDGTTLGNSGGGQSDQLTSAQLPSTSANSSQGFLYGSYVNYFSAAAGSDFVAIGIDPAFPNGASTVSSSFGGDAPHNNVQPTLILNYIIKF